MDIQFPPFLQKGDKVVIVSPSSKIDQQFLKGAKKRIESWGLKVAMGKYAGSSSGRYAGTIRQRLKDLQDAMDDPEVKAILCSRGGYGVVHLIDKIDFTAFHEHPKWLPFIPISMKLTLYKPFPNAVTDVTLDMSLGPSCIPVRKFHIAYPSPSYS